MVDSRAAVVDAGSKAKTTRKYVDEKTLLRPLKCTHVHIGPELGVHVVIQVLAVN